MNFNLGTFRRNEFYGYPATLNVDLGARNKVTSVTALRRIKTRRLGDNEYSALDILYTVFDGVYQ